MVPARVAGRVAGCGAYAMTALPVFLYPPDCAYATDPADLHGVRVGDMVRTTMRYGGGPVEYSAPVLSARRDEYGVYLRTEYRADGLVWTNTANTIVDVIAVVERAPVVSQRVRYTGPEDDPTGQYAPALGVCTVDGPCGCELCPDDGPRWVLTGARYRLTHVPREEFTTLGVE